MQSQELKRNWVNVLFLLLVPQRGMHFQPTYAASIDTPSFKRQVKTHLFTIASQYSTVVLTVVRVMIAKYRK